KAIPAAEAANHYQAARDANANRERSPRARLELGNGGNDFEPRQHGSLGIVFVRAGIAEIGQYSVAPELGEEAIISSCDTCAGGVIGIDHGAHILRIESRRQGRRAHQIADHHGEVTALGLVTRHRFGRCFNRCRSDPIKLRDRAQNLATMPEQNAEVLEVLLRQIADDREVNGVVGEPLGVLTQADRFKPLGNAFHGIQTPRAFLQPVTRSPLVARGLSALACIRRISTVTTVRPGVPAAASMSRMSRRVIGLPALAKIANRRRAGTTSRKSSSCLPARSLCWSDRPVPLPPACARLTTRPVLTGSPAPARTIGMTCFAARTLTLPLETMTSTFCRTNSATISAARPLRPSPHRSLIATVRPSIQPSSRSRCTKAAIRWFSTEPFVGLENPMVGNFGVCCALAASGHAAALPSSVMNSRRFTSDLAPSSQE